MTCTSLDWNYSGTIIASRYIWIDIDIDLDIVIDIDMERIFK